jgi:hypothetical protein
VHERPKQQAIGYRPSLGIYRTVNSLRLGCGLFELCYSFSRYKSSYIRQLVGTAMIKTEEPCPELLRIGYMILYTLNIPLSWRPSGVVARRDTISDCTSDTVE